MELRQRFTLTDAVDGKIAKVDDGRRGGEDEFCGRFSSHEARGYAWRGINLLAVHVRVKLAVVYTVAVGKVEVDDL